MIFGLVGFKAGSRSGKIDAMLCRDAPKNQSANLLISTATEPYAFQICEDLSQAISNCR